MEYTVAIVGFGFLISLLGFLWMENRKRTLNGFLIVWKDGKTGSSVWKSREQILEVFDITEIEAIIDLSKYTYFPGEGK